MAETSGGFTVETAKLNAHSQDAAEAAATGNQVVDAGNQVTPAGWDNAYGLLFQAFPLATHPVAEGVLSLTKNAVQALETTSAAVATAAGKYEDAEQHTAEVLRELAEQLEEVPLSAPGTGLPQPEGEEI